MRVIEKIARLETPRLILRQWEARDYLPYAKIAADPVVMEYFPEKLTREQSDDKVDTMRQGIAKQGWGFWAVEHKQSGELIGLTGLNKPVEIPFINNIEIGWQFATSHWGQGYATEAASRALDFAFDELELPEVVAFTAEINERSRAVMRRLGMVFTGFAFAHPAVPEGNPLKQHVLYSVKHAEWHKRKPAI